MALAKSNPVVFVLDRDGRDWVPVLAASGLTALCEGEEQDRPWIGSVLDGYDFTAADAGRLARTAPPLVVLDDFQTPPPHAHLVVNSAPGLSGSSLNGVPALLGPSYALLDRRFGEIHVRQPADSVEHVVVATGRNDPKKAIARILAALGRNLSLWQQCTVAVGAQAAQDEQFVHAVAELGARVSVRTDVDNMAALYASADVAIGAGGVGMLERMASGTPSLTLTLADNQRLSVNGAVSLGATISCGDQEQCTVDRISDDFARLVADRRLRTHIAERGRAAVDGRGAPRVAEAIIQLVGTLGTVARQSAG